MSDVETLIPEITEDDIEWVRGLMGLNGFDDFRRDFLKRRSTVDLSACPGSGKTTLIVAKLAILAKKWSHRTKGICVLSHTNVAREQIEHRLGRTVIGQKLLTYPHFIDTIHGFVNRFLALPWLYSNGYPSPTIDDEVTTAFRRGVLDDADYWFVESFLRKKYSGFDRLRICARDLSFDLGNRPFPAKPAARSYRYAKLAIEVAANAGYFCYDEMFVWAEALLEDQQNFPVWIAQRFPLVIVDEMQDTSKRQSSFLNAVFPRGSGQFVVQRVGDPNQQIFDLPDSDSSAADPYPDPACCLEIPNSCRFGTKIASLASPFAVRPVGTGMLSGIGPTGPGNAAKECKHAIFVFPDDNADGVLQAFGKHALEVLGTALVAKGIVSAVGHIHRHDPAVLPGHAHYPKSVGHYWSGYAADISRKDPNPNTLAQSVRVAQGLVANGRSLSIGVEIIAAAIFRLARRIGDIGDLKRRTRTHRTILEALQRDAASSAAYRDFLKHFLVEKKALSEDDWPRHAQALKALAAALCKGETDISRAKQFLVWPKGVPASDMPASSSKDDAGPNVFRVSNNNGTVDIQLGTIHSVKGQTHLATLVLNTYWYGHSTKHMMAWLIGNRINGAGAGNQDMQRLLHTYVAMTRPSHLLCVAAPRSALGAGQTMDQTIASLRKRGWHVAEIVEGATRWRK